MLVERQELLDEAAAAVKCAVGVARQIKQLPLFTAGLCDQCMRYISHASRGVVYSPVLGTTEQWQFLKGHRLLHRCCCFSCGGYLTG